MLRRSPRLLALIICSQLLVISAGGQSIEPVDHPNHYVVLVDASGSTTKSEPKRRLYETALRETFASELYREGFGPSIPPYNPERDLLTLLHFGIVVGEAATAYSRLAQYDLLNDFIHIKFTRQPNINAAQFKGTVFPEQRYQYTVLSWAKPLALHRISSGNNPEVTARTFLILIHDGLPNENSIAAELEMIRLWSSDNYDKANPVVATINLNYRFTNGQGAQEPASAQPVTDNAQNPQFFIEAYEVVSTADVEWEARGRALQSFGNLRVEWLDESGEKPRGLLIADLSEEFTDWTKAAEDAEVSLALNNTKYSATGLELPFNYSKKLSCSPPSLNTTFSVALRRTDPILGIRTLNYVAPQVVTAPPLLRCTWVFISLIVLIGVLVIVLLVAATYYLYYRRLETHVYLEIPGTLSPIRFGRKGFLTAIVPMVPQFGLEAFTIRLPNPITQWFLYRGVRLTISSDVNQDPLGWNDPLGSNLLQLPVGQQGVVSAHWRRLPNEPITLTVTFSQGQQRSQLNLTYPRALSESVTRSEVMTKTKIKAWVALDLGSESMAAYFEDVQGRSEMIKLQAHAESLLDLSKHPGVKADPLMEASKVSPRMWNRVSFKANAQPSEPDDDHASLCFVDPALAVAGSSDGVQLDRYEQSLFRFFHSVGDWPHPGGVLPNPKILFQQQVMDVLNAINVSAKDGGRVNLSPEMLIKHLTLQVINNFILSSNELRNYKRDEIHLTITVPNVYSLPHAESIKHFISSKLPNLADVQVLSESDAVAYYALRRIDRRKDSPDLIKFKTEWTNELNRTGKLCLVTMDIGKGTTDLSCILVENPPKRRSLREWVKNPKATISDKRRRHSVQGKTGKSSGGNYLSYILASYYDQRLEKAFQDNPLGLTGAPFGFISKPARDALLLPQSKAVAALEQLINRVKMSMTEDCEIDGNVLTEDEQRGLLSDVVDEILESIKEKEKRTESEGASFEAFRADLIGNLWLPLQTTADRPGLFERLFGSNKGPNVSGGKEVSNSSDLETLKQQIQSYVQENADELFESLSSLVREHQAISDDRASIDGSTFVVVSGQASQFRPLRAAIKKKCGATSIGENQRLLMKGVESKEACCKGVVNFWRNDMLVVNDRELHGTYGCMDYAGVEFEPFEMKNIKNGGSDTVNFNIQSTYLVVFTPRSKEEVDDTSPQVNDGATALLSVFPSESEFTMKYDPDTFNLEVNDTKLAVGNFGDVTTSIYEKVWPEILEPCKE